MYPRAAADRRAASYSHTYGVSNPIGHAHGWGSLTDVGSAPSDACSHRTASPDSRAETNASIHCGYPSIAASHGNVCADWHARGHCHSSTNQHASANAFPGGRGRHGRLDTGLGRE